MKTKHFLIVAAMLMTISSFAQKSIEPEISWTKKQHMTKGFLNWINHIDVESEDSFIFILGTSAEGTFSKSNSYFVKMDMQKGEPESLKIELKDGGVKREWKVVKKLSKNIYVFSSFKNKKDKRHYIFCETLNKEKLRLNKDAKKIGEISYKDVEGDDLEKFVVAESPNKERILLSYSIVGKKGISAMGIQVFDKDLNPIWSRQSDFPRVEGKEVFVGNYTIDNEGNVYLGQNTYDKNKKVWNLYLTCFPVNNGEPRVVEMKFSGDKYAANETIICSPKGEIICAGLYSTPGKNSVTGSFSFLCSPQLGTILSTNEKEFDQKFITMGMKEKDANEILEKKEKGDEFEEGFKYDIDTKYFRKDGGYSLIAEKYKVQTQTVRQGQMSYTNYYYNYNDIVILTYNADGSIRWVQKIPKSQRAVNGNSYYGSYYSAIDDNDNIRLVYNEKLNDEISKETQPILVTVDSKGDYTFTEMFKGNEEVRKTFVPLLAHKLPNNKFLLGRINPTRWFVKGTVIHWGITTLD